MNDHAGPQDDAASGTSSAGVVRDGRPKGYAFVEIEILDLAGYKADYVPRALAAVERHGGRFLHTGRNAVARTGDLSRRRVVLIEFPTFGQAVDFYESTDYAEAMRYRDRRAIVHRYYLLPGNPGR